MDALAAISYILKSDKGFVETPNQIIEGDEETMARKVLDLAKTVVKKTDPEYSIALNNLAILVQEQCRYAEAEALFT